MVGEGNVEDIDPIMPAEDFSFFLQKIPGAFVFVGHGDAAAGSGAALHNPDFHLNEAILPLGATLLADTAVAFLNQGGLRDGGCAAGGGGCGCSACGSGSGRDEL